VKPTSPLYFTAYIKDVPVPRVQIDPGASLNLITLPALEELGISPSKLAHTGVSIFGYDGGKTCVRCLLLVWSVGPA
jgi:hypothetical protein